MWTRESECQQISDQLSGAGAFRKHRIESPSFTRVEYPPPNNYVYQSGITSEKGLNAEVLAWLREAYKIGQQQE
jgi:hypothetical protein